MTEAEAAKPAEKWSRLADLGRLSLILAIRSNFRSARRKPTTGALMSSLFMCQPNLIQIAVSVTPELVQMCRHPRSFIASSAQCLFSGPNPTREEGECVG